MTLTAENNSVRTVSKGILQKGTVHNDNSVKSKGVSFVEELDRDKHVLHIQASSTYPRTPIDNNKLKNNNNNLSRDESHYAALLAVPVIIAGVDMGLALVDQGASRSLIRKSLLSSIDQNITEIKVDRYVVLSSSGKEIPIVSKISVPVVCCDKPLGIIVLYVVDDDEDNDICCGIVLGRTSIAMSPYSHIDTRSGSLYNVITQDKIKCIPCKIERKESSGRLDIIPISCNTNYVVTPKHEERLIKKAKSSLSKMNRVAVLIDARLHLDQHHRDELMTHMIEYIDEYDVPVLPKKYKLEYNLYHITQGKYEEGTDGNGEDYVKELMYYLPHTTPGSKDEDTIISELFSTYVPSKITKTTHQVESTDSMEEIEDIDFPFTAPPPQQQSKQYIKDKSKMITDMVKDYKHLTSPQIKQLTSVLLKYHDVFSMKGENLKQTDIAVHEIDTGDTPPFRERLRNYSPAMQTIIDVEVKKMIDQGVLIPSRSPYASNLLLVRKPDPSSENGMKDRVCASFVKLNSLTRKDSYPLPNIQNIFDSIGKSKWYTTMDLLSGFWQVMVKPEHRHKTAVITARGLYEYAVMAFGLCNAPATFQRLMDAVILPEYRSFVQTYIDDVMTHSLTFEDHMIHLDKTLKLLRDNKLMVKLSKCKFAQLETKFLGHIISEGTLRCNPESISTIQKWMRPTAGNKAVTAVRSFLGMVGWYRKFIPNFATIAAPLFDLTKKSTVFKWDDRCELAFVTLRDALVSKPVLCIADPSKPYILYTDASDIALGAVLMQRDEDGQLHPIAYASKTLNDAQKNYTVTDRECLAIVWALEHFNTYCEGHKYTVVTDHAALSFLRNTTHSKQRMHRLALRLQPYELTVQYSPGKTNYAADLLSRDMMDITSKAPSDTINFNGVSTKKKATRKRNLPIYQVEKIVNRKAIKGRDNEYLYEVQWAGYSSEDNTWEPLENLTDSMDTVIAYEKSRQEAENEKLANTIITDPPVATVSNNVRAPVHDVDCEGCKEAMSDTARYLHNYRVHAESVPSAVLGDTLVSTDRLILKDLQQAEKEFKVIYDTELGTVEVEEPMTTQQKQFLYNHEFIYSDMKILYCIDIPGARNKSRLRTQLRLCVPKPLRQKCMNELHSGKLSNHPGIVHMYDIMREKVWWPGMLSDIALYVKRCTLCQQFKNKKIAVPVQPMSIARAPWSCVAVDHVGPLPISERGNKYILTCIDKFSRYAEAFAVDDIDQKTTAQAIVNGIVCRHGLFDVLQSDRGSAFVSQLAGNIYKELGIKQVKTSAYHPPANGVIEIFNKTLGMTLKIWAAENQANWDVLLPFALFAYNCAYHSTIQESPYYVIHGRDPKTIIDEKLNINREDNVSVSVYATELADKLYEVHTRILEIYRDVNEKRIKKNEGEMLVQFKTGDQVYLHNPTTKKGLSRKLTKRWIGPYIVTERLSNVNYRIVKDGKKRDVHVDRLRMIERETDLLASHESDLSLADNELAAITEAQQSLICRKDYLLTEKSKLEASRVIEYDEQPLLKRNDSTNMNTVYVIECEEDISDMQCSKSHLQC